MRRYTIADVVTTIISFIFGIFILGLLFRLILRLFGANPDSGFTQFIYNSTAPLLEPFRNIFNSVVIDSNSVLESSTLFAIVIYLLLAYIIASLVDFIEYRNKQYRVTTTTTRV